MRVKGLKNIVLSSDQITTHGHEQQKGFLQRLEFVEVKSCGDICTLFPAKLRQGFKNLKSVEIERCKLLKEVFELGEFDEESNEEKELLLLLPSLKTLKLSQLPELICIWKGPTRNVSLRSLTRLNLQDLDKLTFIFPPYLPQSLPQLQTLEVENCRELKHIIREKDGDERKMIAESFGFPQLKTVDISRCCKLEYVFPVSVSKTLQSLPQLETLKIRDCRELEHIIREEDGGREIISESPGFPELKTIFIEKCGKLEYIFPVSVSQTLQNLERMTISYVYNLKQIFYSREGDALTGDGIIKLPQLRDLSLLRPKSNCSFFGPKNFAAQLPSLQNLTIHGHEELGNLLAQLQVRPLYFSTNYFPLKSEDKCK